MKPELAALVTVTLRTTAVTPLPGTPPSPSTSNDRVPAAGTLAVGPPIACLVSRIRTGVRGTKAPGAEGPTSCADCFAANAGAPVPVPIAVSAMAAATTPPSFWCFTGVPSQASTPAQRSQMDTHRAGPLPRIAADDGLAVAGCDHMLTEPWRRPGGPALPDPAR